MRLALGIEYDGSAFFGWQSQKQSPTVQEVMERALARVADHDVNLICAGRTDTGVHASGQVAHFDTVAKRSERSWVLGANANLPPCASVLWVQPVNDEFHARFSALARSYRYTILNRWVRPALESKWVNWCRKPLDAAAMHEAAQALLGEHDFTSFRAAGCSARHAVREIQHIAVARQGDYLHLDITANAFLYHMVRNIAGTLVEVGCGEKPLEWVAQLLARRDRSAAGVTAGAEGLCFRSVRYPDEFRIPVNVPAFPAHDGGDE